jgi:hypothetical protein
MTEEITPLRMIAARQCLLLVKKVKLRDDDGKETEKTSGILDRIIAHLTRECGGNVHDRHVVAVTCGSSEKETHGANAHSGAYDNLDCAAAREASDLEATSYFRSAFRNKEEDIPHTRNNWLCYNFKEKKIVPTHDTIRTPGGCSDGSHLESWLVETSSDGKKWREVAREGDNKHLNAFRFTGTFTVAGGEKCRFIRLVNIGRNQAGTDNACNSAWEIFGRVIK